MAGRIAAAPARAVLEVSGGQSPQHLVNEFARVIAAGDSEVTLIFGSEAISTAEHFAREQAGPAGQDRPDFTEHAEGSLEDRGFGLSGMMSRHQAAHGLTGAPSQYALIDNARRARLGQTREEYAAAMGALFAPFTAVAAANPHASAPVQRGAAELVTPTEANRLIADPYTRYIVAREKVNQGAAVLLMSVGRGPRAWASRRTGGCSCPATPTCATGTCSTGPTCPRARPRCWPSGTRSTWPASAWTRCPRSTCTAASPRRCSTSATGSAWPPTTRAG